MIEDRDFRSSILDPHRLIFLLSRRKRTEIGCVLTLPLRED